MNAPVAVEHRLDVVFSKKGDMKFISHLDLMRLFQRSCRRACLPVSLTKGFSPHIKMSIKRALKLGVESDSEEASFYMQSEVDPADFIKRLNEKLPAGLTIEKSYKVT